MLSLLWKPIGSQVQRNEIKHTVFIQVSTQVSHDLCWQRQNHRPSQRQGWCQTR